MDALNGVVTVLVVSPPPVSVYRDQVVVHRGVVSNLVRVASIFLGFYAEKDAT